MRKGYLVNDSKSLSIKANYIIIFSIIIIITCFIKHYSFNLSLQLDLSSNTDFSNISIPKQDYVTAFLYEENNNKTPTNNYTNTQCSNKFIQANAMVVGDSTAEGLTAYQVLDSNSVIWTRGKTIQNSSDDIKKAASNNPKILFLAYGANDLLSWNGNVEGYINAYKTAVNNIRSMLPKVKICINSILPVSESAISKNSAYSYEKKFNDSLKEFCNEQGITFIDNKELLSQSTDGKIYESDGVHPRPFYYKLWANNMIKTSGI